MPQRHYPMCGTLQDGLWIKRVPSRYSPHQAAEYLAAINYYPLYDEETIASGAFPINLETLERLVQLHMLTFPFENTSMHYTAEHDMDITTEGLFSRFVKDRNGSYCFGHNRLMLEILRGLGFRAYSVGARVNRAPAGGPDSFSANLHMILLVQPSNTTDNTTYIVDVGVGSSCLMRPLLLSADPNNFVYGLTRTERHRLTFESALDTSLGERKVPLLRNEETLHRLFSSKTSLASSSDLETRAGGQWHVEVGHQRSEQSPSTKDDNLEFSWHRQVAFTESFEFKDEDIVCASFTVAHRAYPTGLFWNNVTCVKVMTVDNDPETQHLERDRRAMYRMILFDDEVKVSYGIKSEVVTRFESEVERIRALREIFGIKVKDEDEVYIRGRAAALNLRTL